MMMIMVEPSVFAEHTRGSDKNKELWQHSGRNQKNQVCFLRLPFFDYLVYLVHKADDIRTHPIWTMDKPEGCWHQRCELDGSRTPIFYGSDRFTCAKIHCRGWILNHVCLRQVVLVGWHGSWMFVEHHCHRCCVSDVFPESFGPISWHWADKSKGHFNFRFMVQFFFTVGNFTDVGQDAFGWIRLFVGVDCEIVGTWNQPNWFNLIFSKCM